MCGSPRKKPQWGLPVHSIFRVLVFGLVALVGLITLAWLLYFCRGLLIRGQWERQYGRSGKRVLLVYSRSPHWEEYIETELLPRLEPHVVTLNWSDRKLYERGRSLEWQVFQRYQPQRGFNPLAIVVPPRGRVETISFWQAFRDRKHGKPHTLRATEDRLMKALEAALNRRA